ncbi:TPA: hypothetical protein GRI57_23605 [Vibrio parahaemolyticus]|uniref:hypothetical protein n=1 Tax=Vibrio campbellii TaxID=680 RepID=UPI0005EF8401|nr:hypothetical protein [Vibrio campbellii]HAS6726837.1 hypothetical protein [Vibrio parahaemolyticus]HAS6793820.1 hypothetical protein [Vibrio parahaemolyticus]
MECIDSSFVYSMCWSGILILLIAKINSKEHIKPFLNELYSPPILMAFVIAGIFTWITYEPLPLPQSQTVATFLNRVVHFIQSLACNFNTTFNVLGIILPFITVHAFLKEHYPEVLQAIKEKIGLD